MDEQEYLEPGFDPSTLTVPRLRSILVAHSISYPASAKKSQLIEIFEDKVASQSRRLRAANARVKRTSRGIENVTPVKNEPSDEEIDEVVNVRATRTPAKTPRRTTRARTEEVEEVQPPRSTRHSTAPPESMPRHASGKHARTSELETIPSEPEAKRTASRKSRAGVKDEPEDTSPFSNDNVFQAGSSPLAPPTTDRRRTTLGTSRSISRSRTREPRRKTEDLRQGAPQQDGVVVPTRRTFEMPVAQLKQELHDDIEPTEEFTPEEQQSLVRQPQSNAVISRRRKQKSAAGSVARTGVTSILTALLATAGYLWSEEKFRVGYCGVGQPSTELHGVEIPEWADSIRPPCEPCPPHAYCHEKLITFCESGFVLKQHPLSIGGLLPLPPTCEADSARARRVQAVKDRAIEELREQNAKYECGQASKSELKETDLKKTIATMRRRDMSNEEFEDLWASALGELQAVEDITSSADTIGNPTLRSSSLARVPISCAIRRSLRETLRRYVWTLVMLAFLASGGAYGRQRITSSRFEEKKAKELASLALRKLSEQASLHAVEPDTWEEGYISVAQLRDDVLRDEFSATRRKKIWEKVQKKVEGNANVRPMVREGRGGDVGRVWEWIGARGAIESPPFDRRRSAGYRDSLGGIAGDRLIEAGSEQPSTGKVVRWQESGQYF
ncbi:hypothetical protein AMS68_004269 [Peltaster fructicola]|uniref:LEM-like domain-containing protein n=1 Tax=Peltaster fructicola TaxID=286661 RepID=A0A6H0XVF8_9PEZI|nr:hypothetical protein AMS68_004269 [Peltaster fructicola]